MGINTFNTDLPGNMLYAISGMTKALEDPNKSTFLGSLANKATTDVGNFFNTLGTYNTNNAQRYLDSLDPAEITKLRNEGVSNEDIYTTLLANKGYGRGVQINANNQDLMNKYGSLNKAEKQKRDFDLVNFTNQNINNGDVLGLSDEEFARRAGYMNLDSTALQDVNAARLAGRKDFLTRQTEDYKQNYRGKDPYEYWNSNENLKGFNPTQNEINFAEQARKENAKDQVFKLAVSMMREDEAKSGAEPGTYSNSREKQLEYFARASNQLGWGNVIIPEEVKSYSSSADPDALPSNKGIRDADTRKNELKVQQTIANDPLWKTFTGSVSDFNNFIDEKMRIPNGLSRETADKMKADYAKGKARTIYRAKLNDVNKIIDNARIARGGNFTDSDVLTISSTLSDIHNALLNNDLPDNEFLEEATKALNLLSGSAKSAVDLTERLKSNSINNNKKFVLSGLDPTSQAYFYMNKIFEGDYKADRDNNLAYEKISKHIKDDNTPFSQYQIIEQLNKPEFKQSDLGKVITNILGQAYNDYLKDVKEGKVKGYSTVAGFFNSKRGEQMHTLLNSLSNYDVYSRLLINYDNKKSLRTLDQAASK